MRVKKRVFLVIGLICGLIIVYLRLWDVGKAASPPTFLSASTVSSPTIVSKSSNNTTRPVIVADNNNALYVAWEQDGEAGGKKDIFQSANNGPGWSTPAAVYTSSVNSQRPVMATGPDGNPHIVWKEENIAENIYTTVYQKGLTPTTPIFVPPVITTAILHDIVVDSRNVVHLTMQGNKFSAVQYPFKILYSQDTAVATDVYDTKSTFGSLSPTIANDSQGNLHLAWQEVEGALGTIYYSKGITGGGSISWLAATAVPTYGAVITDGARPSIVVDSKDNVHLVWTDRFVDNDSQYVYYTRSPASSTAWITPTRVTPKPVGVNNAVPTYVEAVVAVSGDIIYIAWHDKSDDHNNLEEVFYSFSIDGGATWATPINVSNSSGVQSLNPQIAADNEGGVHFVWQECKTANISCANDIAKVHEVRYARTLRKVFLPVVLKIS